MFRRCLCAALAGLATLGSMNAVAQAPQALVGELKSLGQDRYRIGHIVVDRAAHRFLVPGRIHVLGQPLEYLATSPGGMKEYETLLELDATGSEFNLACILLGLERDPNQAQFRQFSRAPLVGQRLAISIAWTEGGRQRRLSAAEAVLNPDAGVSPESVEWVYTGAPASSDGGPFAADTTGTLVGFVHDANTIVESTQGLGIGAYGSVRGNPILPAVGSAVEMIVDVLPARP